MFLMFHILQFAELKKRVEAEQRKKYPLEQRFREVIVGQEAAINAVASGNNQSNSDVIKRYIFSTHPCTF